MQAALLANVPDQLNPNKADPSKADAASGLFQEHTDLQTGRSYQQTAAAISQHVQLYFAFKRRQNDMNIHCNPTLLLQCAYALRQYTAQLWPNQAGSHSTLTDLIRQELIMVPNHGWLLSWMCCHTQNKAGCCQEGSSGEPLSCAIAVDPSGRPSRCFLYCTGTYAAKSASARAMRFSSAAISLRSARHPPGASSIRATERPDCVRLWP